MLLRLWVGSGAAICLFMWLTRLYVWSTCYVWNTQPGNLKADRSRRLHTKIKQKQLKMSANSRNSVTFRKEDNMIRHITGKINYCYCCVIPLFGAHYMSWMWNVVLDVNAAVLPNCSHLRLSHIHILPRSPSLPDVQCSLGRRWSTTLSPQHLLVTYRARKVYFTSVKFRHKKSLTFG